MTNLANFTGYAGYYASLIVANTPPETAFMRQFYRLLEAYYLGNDVYQVLNGQLRTTRSTNQPIKPLRNPTNRVVEFYAAKLWGDDLNIITDNPAIIDPIEQVWRWSNFDSMRQRWARWHALFGDLFLKVNTKQDAAGKVTAVYHQLIEPEFVTDFDIDERGFVTWIRLDIPRWRRLANGEQEERVHTEVWDKSSQIWRVWDHTGGLDEELDRIQATSTDGEFTEAHGGDFVPFVYQPFRDDGFSRANGAITAQLDKIDELNRKATRLASLLFRHGKADMALTSNAMDPSGRPLPPPAIGDIDNSAGEVEIAGERFWRLPSGWDVRHLIAPLNYDAHLSAIDSDIAELEKDLPELAWANLTSRGDVSGRALKFILDAAVSRATEARRNAEAALQRADEMALTIGQEFGLFPDTIGSYESGGFTHEFEPRDIIPPDEVEQAQMTEQYVRAGADLRQAARLAGHADEVADGLAATRRLIPSEV